MLKLQTLHPPLTFHHLTTPRSQTMNQQTLPLPHLKQRLIPMYLMLGRKKATNQSHFPLMLIAIATEAGTVRLTVCHATTPAVVSVETEDTRQGNLLLQLCVTTAMIVAM
ncbi:uncharacterized protein LOC100180335 [Ciona intestinalis]